MSETLAIGPALGLNLKAKRVSTGNVAASLGVNVTVTWDEPFETNQYTISAQVLFAGDGENLRVEHIQSKTLNNCVIHVRNASLSAKTGELHVIAIED